MKYHFPCSLPTFTQVFVMLENRLASTSSFRPDPLQLESGFRPDLRKRTLKKCRKNSFLKKPEATKLPLFILPYDVVARTFLRG